MPLQKPLARPIGNPVRASDWKTKHVHNLIGKYSLTKWIQLIFENQSKPACLLDFIYVILRCHPHDKERTQT